MKILNKLLKNNAYSLDPLLKKKIFNQQIKFLNIFHYKKSALYKNYIDGLNFQLYKDQDICSNPFIPVRLFKEFDFMSIDKKKIFKTLASSGTTSNNTSKIYIDKNNALNQIKVLQNIFNNIVGKSRLPMLVVDKQIKIFDRSNFNASAAAVSGFSIFANEITYLLNEYNEIDYDVLNAFIKKNEKKNFLVFGFTSNIYSNLIQKLNNKKIKIKNFSNAYLVHGGGWKKLENKKVERKKFNHLLNKKLGFKNIINYYGLVEQIGSIFFECKCGYLIASNFSDIIIRDENLRVCKNGKKGVVQLLSLLPTSYPGHNILTEDVGEIIDDENCKCYGYGKRFLIHGRLESAELRGCSNT